MIYSLTESGWGQVMKLTFVIAACMVPCFIFVTETMWITHLWFNCCWAEHQGPLCFSLAPRASGLGMGRSMETDHSQDRGPHLTKGMPYANRASFISFAYLYNNSVSQMQGRACTRFTWQGCGSWGSMQGSSESRGQACPVPDTDSFS